MHYRLHTFYLNNSIGIWLRSVLNHPNAIIVKEDSLLGKEIVAYKEALAKDLLKFKNKTPTENFIEQTRDLQLALLKLKGVVQNLSEDQISNEREIILANANWRSDLADEGKTIEEIQEIERKTEYEHFSQREMLDKTWEPQSSNLSFSTQTSSIVQIDIQEEQDYFKTSLKRLEEDDKAALERLTIPALQKNSVFGHGFFSRLLFTLKRFLTVSL